MNDDLIINNDSEFVIELLTETQAQEEFKLATSATVTNPAVSWAKFVLTDDKPNGNKQRIPKEEFPNLIKSGVYMPIKMAKGVIRDGHEVSEPIGVITNLMEQGNQILGLAALWTGERTDDVGLIKDLIKQHKKVNLSWEILFRDSNITADGIEELRGTFLRASTIVNRPAYGDRTPILAIAAKNSPAYLDDLPDDAFLYVQELDGAKIRTFPFMDRNGNIDRELLTSSLEEIKASTLQETLAAELISKATSLLEEKVEDVKEPDTEDIKLDELETLKTELESAKSALEDSKAVLEAKEQAILEKEAELVTLREFKASIEAAASKAEKLGQIKEKFNTSGITKEDSYYVDNEEFLLGLSEAALDFLLQELVAFSSKISEASLKVTIPNLVSENTVTSDIKQIAEALRKNGK